MKAKKKPLGMKQKIREERKNEERIGLAIIVAILVTIIFVSGFVINSMLNQPLTNQTLNSTSQTKAAIVDHLSLTYPNQTFIQTATNTLKQAGYTVDYYPGEKITVEFYRNLPAQSYGLIILRVHSCLNLGTQPPVMLFTSEPYSKNKYLFEQLTDQIGSVQYSIRDENIYFGMASGFIESSTNGKFQNAIVVMMGCNGLTYIDMAEAFIKKGAKVYISWNGSVLASYTDQATTRLLQHFLTEKLALKESVQETFKEVGADPKYNSLLLYYPLEAEDCTIQNQANNIVASSVEIQPQHKTFYKRKILTASKCL